MKIGLLIFCWLPLIVDAQTDTLIYAVKPFLPGKDPFDRELIWQTLSSWRRKGLPMIGAGAIDVCLWDIAGKALGVPVYQLLGAYRKKMRVYASTSTLGKPADYADVAKQLCAQGYTAMKLHVKGRPSWRGCWTSPSRARNICMNAIRRTLRRTLPATWSILCAPTRGAALRRRKKSPTCAPGFI